MNGPRVFTVFATLLLSPDVKPQPRCHLYLDIIRFPTCVVSLLYRVLLVYYITHGCIQLVGERNTGTWIHRMLWNLEGAGTTSCSLLRASRLDLGPGTLNLRLSWLMNGDKSTAVHGKLFDTMKRANHMFVSCVRRRDL